MSDPDLLGVVTERAIAHLEKHALEGSDPGLCVAAEDNAALPALIAFGKRAATEVVTQADCRRVLPPARTSRVTAAPTMASSAPLRAWV